MMQLHLLVCEPRLACRHNVPAVAVYKAHRRYPTQNWLPARTRHSLGASARSLLIRPAAHLQNDKLFVACRELQHTHLARSSRAIHWRTKCKASWCRRESKRLVLSSASFAVHQLASRLTSPQSLGQWRATVAMSCMCVCVCVRARAVCFVYAWGTCAPCHQTLLKSDAHTQAASLPDLACQFPRTHTRLGRSKD